MPGHDAIVTPATAPRGWRGAVVWLAFAAVLFQAATAMTGFALLKPEYGAALAALLLPLAGRDVWRSLCRSTYVRALCLFVLFVLAQTLWLDGSVRGVSLQELAEDASKPVKLGLLAVAIGAWLSRRPRMIGLVLRLMLVGLVVQGLVSVAQLPLPMLLDGSMRLSLGYAENLGGAYAAIGALAFILMALDLATRPRRWPGQLALSAAMAAAAFLLACLVLAGSRGAWLAAAATLPAIVCLYAWRTGWRPARTTFSMPRLLLLLGLCVATFVVVVLVRAAGSERLEGAAQISDAVLEGSFNAIPMSPVGVRLHLLRYGTELFTQHPLVGHGLGSIGQLVAQSDIRDNGFPPPHMHNAYLQVLVGVGLLGGGLLLWGMLALGRGVYRGYRRGCVDAVTFWLLAGCGSVMALVNLFDCLTWHMAPSRVPLEVMIGCALAVSLRANARAAVPAH